MKLTQEVEPGAEIALPILYSTVEALANRVHIPIEDVITALVTVTANVCFQLDGMQLVERVIGAIRNCASHVEKQQKMEQSTAHSHMN